jgi:hypothetical protein
MQTDQGNMLHSLQAVQAFLEENAATLAGVAKSGARRRLADVIAQLSIHASDQTGNALAAQGATRKQKALRTTLLRDHMAPISRIARVDLPQTPELEPLRMPQGKPTAQRLAAAAYGMTQAAAPFAEVFTSAGLPVDFIAQLNAAADAMLLSLSERSQHRGRLRGATIGLKTTLATGRKIVHVLDAFVRTALRDDPALLANWNHVKRVPRPAGRSSTAAQPPAASGPETPAAPAAGTSVVKLAA